LKLFRGEKSRDTPTCDAIRKPGRANETKIDLGIERTLPGGVTERFNDLPFDRYITVVEGRQKWE
jgi:hypothetical protein